MMGDYSKERALEMLRNYIVEVTELYPENITFILLVGSLTNDSYIEAPGRDIDQITVLRNEAPSEIYSGILDLINRINGKNSEGVTLAKSIYYLNELKKPYKKNFKLELNNKRLLEVPVELLRIFESGKILYGDSNILEYFDSPSKDDVIYFAKLKSKGYGGPKPTISETMDVIKKLTPRLEVQIILTSAMCHYYYATGISCSNKHKIAEVMKQDVIDYRFQEALDLATEFKLNIAGDFPEYKVELLRNLCESLLRWNNQNEKGIVPML